MLIRDFEKLLSETVDKALSSLGETQKKAIYSRLEESFNIKRPEVPYKISDFQRAIEQILGARAYSVERLIVNLLDEKVGRTLKGEEPESVTFADRIRHIRERLYKEFIDGMQSGLAVFYFEDVADLGSFRLVAANSTAQMITGMTTEKAARKSIIEIYPGIQKTDIPRVLMDVVRSGRPRDLGEFGRNDYNGDRRRFLVGAFPISNDYVCLVLKNIPQKRQVDETPKRDHESAGDVFARDDHWKWEIDTGERYVFSERSRAQELWVRREVATVSHAKYFSARGKEYLQVKEVAKAREFFGKAEETYLKLGGIDEAFENASWRLNTFASEENVQSDEFFRSADEYTQKYKDYAMDPRFIENLAHISQWKGYRQCEEMQFNDARASYSDAEELFVTLKQKDRALFNASQHVLTYVKEGRIEEYMRSAESFLDKYREIGVDRHYKEVLGRYFCYKADESKDLSGIVNLRRDAEKLFLEIGLRHAAFENACKLIDLYWDNESSESESFKKECFEATERFFEEYKDFVDHEYYKRRLSKYYLLQARTLASQLKQVLY